MYKVFLNPTLTTCDNYFTILSSTLYGSCYILHFWPSVFYDQYKRSILRSLAKLGEIDTIRNEKASNGYSVSVIITYYL